MSYLAYQLNLVRSPTRTLAEIRDHPRAFAIGLVNISGIALAYELAILLWYLGDARITLPSILAIPEELYYQYELMFLVPVFFITWLLGAAITYAAAAVLGGSGNFGSLLGGLGVSVAVSSYWTLIPDLVQGIIFSTGIISQADYLVMTAAGFWPILVWGYLTGYLVTNITLYAIAASQILKLDRAKSLLAGFLGFTGYFALFITFIR